MFLRFIAVLALTTPTLATITFPGIGLELGAGFATTYTWDSNIENRADGAAAGKIALTPTISFQKTGGVLTLKGTLSSSYSRYISAEERPDDENPTTNDPDNPITTAGENRRRQQFVDPFNEEPFNEYDASLSAALNEYTDAWNATLGLGFSDSVDDTFEEEDGITRSQRYRADAGVSFFIASRTSFSLNTGYDSRETDGFSDQNTYSGRISLGYNFRDDLRFSFGVNYSETDVNEANRFRLNNDATTVTVIPGEEPADAEDGEESIDGEEADPEPVEDTVITTREIRRERSLDSRNYGVFVSGNGNFTGTLNGTATVGLQQREYEDPEREPTTSTFFNVGLDWAPTDLVKLRFTVGQDFATSPSGEGTNTFRAGVATSRSLTEQLSTGINLSFRRTDFESPIEDIFLVTTERTVPAGTRPEDLPPEEQTNLSEVDLVALERADTAARSRNRTEETWTIGVNLSYRFIALGSVSARVNYSRNSSDSEFDNRPRDRTSATLSYNYTF